MHTIRAALVGVGAMNAMAAELLLDKGVEIVGAVGRRPSRIGMDVGDALRLGRTLGVAIASDAQTLFESARPDVALVATTSFMPEIFEPLAVCARQGVNAITLAEEMTFPWLTSPEKSQELDALARTGGVTLLSSGFQDFFHVNQIVGLLGAAHRIDRVLGRQSFNVDDYGPEVARDQLVGMTMAEFTQRQEQHARPSFSLPILAAITDASDLTIDHVTSEPKPDIATEAAWCAALGRTVPAGQLIGFTSVDTIYTKEGPTLTMELGGRVYRPGETDDNEWWCYGDPDLRLLNPAVNTRRTTCTQLVNRIPDVINAEPGLLGPHQLPLLHHRPRPLAEYVHV